MQYFFSSLNYIIQSQVIQNIQSTFSNLFNFQKTLILLLIFIIIIKLQKYQQKMAEDFVSFSQEPRSKELQNKFKQ
ncbi:unnamed protein product (macronuclear) [Paramecium tetraurelia]|uniref:Transmembrane protein n=1 Tax=Paramecium tetraurelia TaxID=5888 RepID=A0CP21_PARTE|nr:uncharacterized protein GSPATT00008929001 [Paramecium tetraurelia]CAK72538.1 unnamed protein product [Paramecium tetraurelia]|eukprot:XP_001439935.1 hypothetical protein (macronuclear) [Paramecium tetraurelia strain d4-2]